MNLKDLIQLGIPEGDALRHARSHMSRLFAQGLDREEVEETFKTILANPKDFLSYPDAGKLAHALAKPPFVPRKTPAPWKQWGEDLEPTSIKQMVNASELPVAVAGALMPDAHLGYGLPIGGVLATENVVIPYAVGVDIACRMKLTVYDCKPGIIAGQRDRLKNILENETRFGLGSSFKDRRMHDVLDEDWSITPLTRRLREKAWAQLGTSGSGNHFVEFGVFTVTTDDLGIPPGKYVGLLSHSGSRGTGAQICSEYSKRAMEQHNNLPQALRHLAWLSLDEADGQEYWAAMNLMGRYAAANHHVIHKHIAKAFGEPVILDIENHHNFAWKERHVINGEEREVIVHRKGATPAGAGVLGIIPGSMATPGFVVRGKGNPESLCSAAHGAGRVMSRTQAAKNFTWSATKKLLTERNVELLSAGLDEVPGVYKDIHSVMAAQTDLVDVLGRFDPRLVKMCPAGERPED